MSHARWTTTHVYTSKHPRKLEDTKLERPLRRLLERLSREVVINFASQDLRYDFWLQGVPIDVQGLHHKKQTQLNHDGFKASQIIELGLPSPLFIYPNEILKKSELVYNLLRALALLKGAEVSGNRTSDENARRVMEPMIRIANKYGFLCESRPSSTHVTMRHDETGEPLEIEFLEAA
jgi:hypothetical protein